MDLGSRWQFVAGRPSGFDYLRIVLATSVVLWHSYQVSYGTLAAIQFWTSNPIGYLLAIILPMFFSLSGFLVAGSMHRNPNLRAFLTLRVIRIFPALVVEVALAAVLLGALMTSWSLSSYYSSRGFAHYFLNIIGFIHYLLPGVFLHNPHPQMVNSQLWTVPFELECYVLISLVFFLGFFKSRSRVLPLFILATIGLAIFNKINHQSLVSNGGGTGDLLVLCFFAGVVVHAYRDHIPFRADLAGLSFILVIFLPHISDTAAYLMPIFAAYLTVFLGLLNPKRNMLVKTGDYSYGLYIYSCPIQQAIEQATGYAHSWALNIAISLPIIVCFALFSWWCVEKPFLKVKRFVLATPVRARAPVEGNIALH